MRPTRRRLSLSIVITLVGMGYAGTQLYERHDFIDEFIERKDSLSSTEENVIEEDADYRLVDFRLENGRGLAVEGSIRFPTGEAKPFPTLLTLGGLRTGRKTLEFIDPIPGVIVVALDYPYPGKQHGLNVWEFLTGIPRMRQAILNTVPALMLTVDYLLAREDVDPRRVVLIGGSLGALFSPAAGAADGRLAGVALLFGAGELRTLLSANLEAPRFVRPVGGWMMGLLVSPLEPLKYIGRISPRPLFMLNGTGDPKMPERCSRLLHERAGEPKTIRWVSAGHVDVRDREFHEVVSRELSAWLIERGFISKESVVNLRFDRD